MSEALALLFVLATPLALAGLCLPRRTARPAWHLAPWAALPAVALALLAPAAEAVELRWLLLGMRLGLTDLTRVFLLFTAVLWLLAAQFARGYLTNDARRMRFAAFFLLTMSGNLGLILARDVASFYLFFALMTFAAYGLVVHSGEAAAYRAGKVYIALAVFGEALLLSGLIMAAGSADSLALDEIPGAVAASSWRAPIVALLFAGFGVKAGVLLLHVWLPLAHPVAPTPASAVLSGAMIKAGLLGWVLFLPLGRTALPEWSEMIAAAGIAAAFYGAAIGLTQRDAKAVLAYSSISQMGLMTIALAAAVAAPEAAAPGTLAATVYALHHGLAKGALFLGVGVPRCRAGYGRLLVLAGLLLPALALSGAPFTSGALAKHQLKEALALVEWGPTLKPALSLAAIGTTLVLARFLVLVHRQASADGRGLSIPLAWSASVGASLASVWLLSNGWLGIEISSGSELWSDAWPVLAGIAMSALATTSTRWRPSWHVPPGDVLGIGLRGARWLLRVAQADAAIIGERARQAYQLAAQRWAALRSLVYPAWLRGERALLSHAGTSALLAILLLVLLALAWPLAQAG